MKKNIITQMVVHPAAMLFCLLLAAGNIAAQTTGDGPKLCGGAGFIDTAALNKAREYEANGGVLRASSNYQVRVYFHILTNDDGTNAAATVEQINSEFAILGYDYSLGNICFVNCGYSIINSTSLNTKFNANTSSFSLFNPYLAPGCINVFYMQSILGSNAAGGSNGGYGGFSQSIPGTLSLVATGNIGQGQSISHEVGHCLGLFHTFEPAHGLEDINGSNSATTADLIQDTPADPWAFNQTGNTCFATASGNYSGNCTDPNGASNYSPPYTNLMAYWWSIRAAAELIITPDQFTRENSTLASTSSLEACESVPGNITLPSTTISSGFDIQSTFGSMSNTSGTTCAFTGTVNAALTADGITLHPGFIATPGTGGLVNLTATNCSFAPAGPAGGDGSLMPVATGISSPAAGDEQIQVIPNPFNSSFELSVTVVQDEKTAITIYNVVGERVKEVPNQNFTAGNNKISFDCSALPGGIYFIEVQSDAAHHVIKIVKN